MKTQTTWCKMLEEINMKKLFCILLLAPLAMGLSGCVVVQKIDSLNGILEAPPPDSEVGQLLQAEFSYYEGNYQLAEEIYTLVKESTKKDIYKNQAVYGLACIQIISAETIEELKEGFAMLEAWQEPGGTVDGYEENPKMIAVALKAKTDLFECEPEIRYVTTKKKGELLEKHKNEIRELKLTIEKLEHQISVLEAIDQEIQEKRKPL